MKGAVTTCAYTSMMDPEENDVEELEAVPSHVFDSVPSPVSALGGWATGAGSALFAVTKVRNILAFPYWYS